MKTALNGTKHNLNEFLFSMQPSYRIIVKQHNVEFSVDESEAKSGQHLVVNPGRSIY
jgi:hypothetical protein